MMKRLNRRFFLAVLASTVVMVFWGMLFWAVLYEPLGVYKTLPDRDSLASLLEKQNVETGTYFVPWPRNTSETMEVWLEKHKKGPFFKLSYVKEGVDPQSPGKMLFGILHNVVISFLASLMLSLALPALPSYSKRVLLVFLAGTLGTLLIQVGDPIWFHLPWDYPLGNLVYELGTWLLMGLVLGGILKPQ